MSADLVGTVRREDYDGGYSIWLRARTTAAGEHWVCIHASSSAPGNPGMGWGPGWDPIEDRTAMISAVPGTPAAEVFTDDVTARGVAVYVPTPVQTAIQDVTVAALDSLSSSTRLVNAVPVDSVATEPCGNDWSHGPGIVYGGPCEGLCLACAVAAVTAAPRGATDPDVVSLDVLRAPAGSEWGRSGGAPPVATCMECGTAAVTPDWLIEDVPTIGGGLIAVRFCFGCRGLAAWPVPERRDDDSGDIDARLPDARELR